MRKKNTLKNYYLFQLIGKGAFGQVRIAKDKQSSKVYHNQDEIVAIKRIQKKKLIDKKQLSSAYVEKELMIKNNNSNFLIRLHSTFQDRNYLYLVMDYAAGGDLLHLLIEKDTFTEEETKFYIAEMIVALQEMQCRNMIHRDIKPDNILIDKNGHIKISDFGLSKHISSYQAETVTNQRLSVPNQLQNIQSIFKNRRTHNFQHKQCINLQKMQKIKERTSKAYSKVGTPDYISPEVLFSHQYDYSVDIWSVGVIMFECLFGYPPFFDQDPRQVCKKVANWSQNLIFPQDNNVNISIDAKLLILGMINQRSKRLTINQIKEHVFFKGIEWNKIKQYRPPYIPKLQHQLDTRNFDQLEETQKWSDESSIQEIQRNGIEDNQNNKRVRSSAKVRSTSADYLFAGFEYRNIGIEPFQLIENQLNAFNKVKKFVHNQPLKFRKQSPYRQKKIMNRLLTENNDCDKSKQKINGKIRSQRFLLKKPTTTKNTICNPNHTICQFFNPVNSKLNNSISNIKQKSSFLKQSKLKPVRKTINYMKNMDSKLIT